MPTNTAHKPYKWTKWIIVGVVIVIAVALGFGLGFGLKRSSTTPTPTPFPSVSPVSDRVLGLDYDTGILSGTPNPTAYQACVTSDLTQIRDAGYNSFRTYFPIFGFQQCTQGSPIGKYAAIAHDLGIKVLLGVNRTQYATYKECILQQLDEYPTAILGVSIGNESVQDGNWGEAAEILNVANDLRATCVTRGIKVPRVGTCQQSGFGVCAFACTCTDLCGADCQAAYRSLEANLDFLGFNVYPGSNGGPAIATSDPDFNAASSVTQMNLLLDGKSSNPTACPGLSSKLWITESGMPWSGSCANGSGVEQVYTRALQTDLIAALENWQTDHKTTPLFIFMAFDTPSKPDAPGCGANSGEKTFGVLSNPLCPRASS